MYLILVSKNFRKKKFHERHKGLWFEWNLDLPVDFICYTPDKINKLKKEVSIVSEALRKVLK